MLTGSQPDAPNEHSPTLKGVFALLILGFPLELPASGNLHVFGIQARVWQWRTTLIQCLEDGWHRRLGSRFTFLVWMGSFSVAVKKKKKTHNQSNLREKGFILAYSSETESVMVGKARRQAARTGSGER